jgi:hypothetical protein
MTGTIARLLVMLFGLVYGSGIVREMIWRRRQAVARNEVRLKPRRRAF